MIDERGPFADAGITMQEAADGIEFVGRAILADPFLRAMFAPSTLWGEP